MWNVEQQLQKHCLYINCISEARMSLYSFCRYILIFLRPRYGQRTSRWTAKWKCKQGVGVRMRTASLRSKWMHMCWCACCTFQEWWAEWTNIQNSLLSWKPHFAVLHRFPGHSAVVLSRKAEPRVLHEDVVEAPNSTGVEKEVDI